MVVRSSLRAGRPLPPRKIHGTNFCYGLSQPQSHSVAERIRSIEKFSDLIGNRTSFRLVAYRVPPVLDCNKNIHYIT
jgi:hypothetical protein